MLFPVQNFFLQSSKIHTVSSSACVLPPPPNHIYEVFRVIDGVPLFLEDHMQRLQFSLESAGITYINEYFLENIEKVLLLNAYAEGNIKIIVWLQGKEIHDMIYYDKHSYPDKEMFQNGVMLGILGRERINPNVKLFDNNMRKDAQHLIEDENFYEVLLCTNEGLITEGSRSNVFFIKGDKIITPPSAQVLEGVTRKKVISLIHSLHLSFSEETVHLDELHTYDSVFITGTSRRVLPVHSIQSIDTLYNCSNKLIRKLQDEFMNATMEYVQLKKRDK